MEEALTAMVERAVAETGVHGRTRVAVGHPPGHPPRGGGPDGAELLVVGSEEVAS